MKIFFNLEEAIFLTIKTLEEKFQICKEYIEEGKSISYMCELYQIKDKIVLNII